MRVSRTSGAQSRHHRTTSNGKQGWLRNNPSSSSSSSISSSISQMHSSDWETTAADATVSDQDGLAATPLVSGLVRRNSREPSHDVNATADIRQDEGKWIKFWTRTLWGLIMIVSFLLLIAAGHFAMVILVIFLQTSVFQEVLKIGHAMHRERRLLWFRTQMWSFLLCAYYFLYGEMAIHFFKSAIFSDAFLAPLAIYHRFISFCLYLAVLIGFILNLRKGHYRFQFNQFGLVHMTLLLAVAQSQFVIHNIFSGFFWFLLPVSMVIFNDIMAYFFGFFMGRTPLIKISPKKTWEGFIGAFVSTMIFGFAASSLMARYPFFTCPADLKHPVFFSWDHWINNIRSALGVLFPKAMADLGSASAGHAHQCSVNPLFEMTSYRLPAPFSALLRLILGRCNADSFSWGLFGCVDGRRVLQIYPVQIHALVISIFVSLVAPFGGFFASGFKRAFKVKDFAASIPGHGGITDRMDCQFLAGFFVYLYYASFLNVAPISAGALLERAVNELPPTDLLQLYDNLREYLAAHELL